MPLEFNLFIFWACKWDIVPLRCNYITGTIMRTSYKTLVMFSQAGRQGHAMYMKKSVIALQSDTCYTIIQFGEFRALLL